MSETHVTTRFAAVLLLVGAALLLIGNTVHPVDVESSATSRLALADTAAWMPIHLTIAVGVLAVIAGLAVLARVFHRPLAAAFARVGVVAAIVGGGALVLVFGALDGYAQASLAGAWQASSGVEREGIETVALALDTIDSGMTAVGILALFGVALLAFGAALVASDVVRHWVGWAACAIGLLGVVTGTLFAILGSTPLVINGLFRPLALITTVYLAVLAVALVRVGRSTATVPA